ncbi:MAG TPA: hypothetical protein VJM08_16635, partial [Anaerolineales bacterium]|nr:hypothetical protein [Anaerolineales bacterium]
KGVSVGCGARVGDRVIVRRNGIGETVAIWFIFVVQLLIVRITRITRRKYLKNEYRDPKGFFRPIEPQFRIENLLEPDNFVCNVNL